MPCVCLRVGQRLTDIPVLPGIFYLRVPHASVAECKHSALASCVGLSLVYSWEFVRNILAWPGFAVNWGPSQLLFAVFDLTDFVLASLRLPFPSQWISLRSFRFAFRLRLHWKSLFGSVPSPFQIGFRFPQAFLGYAFSFRLRLQLSASPSFWLRFPQPIWASLSVPSRFAFCVRFAHKGAI